MRIDIIDTDAGFEAIRQNWETVFMADPHSRHFLSWGWLRDYMPRRKRWFILALRERSEGSPYVAFFPLRIVTEADKKTGRFHDSIVMAGNAAADYTGFITLPEYENNAVAGFCSYIRQQNWTELKLDYLSGPPERRDAMIRALQGPLVMFRDNMPTNPYNINNCICPVVALPDTFDSYLDSHMSSQSRQKLRRFMRKVEGGDEYRITFATRETIKRDMGILFDFWRIRWAPHKGKERTELLIGATRQMLMDVYIRGDLEVPVLWFGDQPLGALANIIDRQKKSVLFYITGRDENWKTPSPGLVLHGHCIRRAIEQGFKTYDFLRGNEPYKYFFGPEEHKLSCTLFRTRSGDNLGGKLHPRSIRFVYEEGLKLYKTGKKAAANIAFSQVLAAAPDHLGAQFGLANLTFDRGEFREAEIAFLGLLGSGQDPVLLWMRIGEARLAQRQYHEASEAFRQVTNRAPFHREALYKCAVALIAAERTMEGAEILDRLQHYHSDDATHLEYAEKARAALARLELGKARIPLPADVITLSARPKSTGKRWRPPKVLH